MPKFVYVQINGIEKPAKIRADKIEKHAETIGSLKHERLVVMKENEPVGEFKPESIVGWWIEDGEDD